MQTEAEFTLMAENWATAALASTEPDDRLECVLNSAIWRNEALRLRLGERAWMLRTSLFDDDQLRFI